MNWKSLLMLFVILGALACMIISFLKGEYVVGFLSGLTVVAPAVIWYSDNRENRKRDRQLEVHDNSLKWHEHEISKKADSEQGFYDV